MSKNKNRSKLFVFSLITSLILLAALSSATINVKAQGQATVIVLNTVGGTTDPAEGTYTYADGSSVELSATDDGYSFFTAWVIDNSADGTSIVYTSPTTITVNGGATYTVQAQFQPILLAPGSDLVNDVSKAAIIVILPAAGGTTNPKPGSYQLADTSVSSMTAMPDNGYVFSHWVISGMDTSHGGFPFNPVPTTNPYPLDHGYGYTYNYQPVFVPTGVTEPTPTPTASAGIMGGLSMDTAIIIGLVVIIIIILVAFAVVVMRKNKK